VYKKHIQDINNGTILFLTAETGLKKDEVLCAEDGSLRCSYADRKRTLLLPKPEK
jgi:hypothetical protein